MARNAQKGHLVTKNDPTDDVAIRVDHVSKSFILPHNKQNSIKGGLINIFNGDRSYEKQEVLKDVSFEIKKGEFFGIVGRNGSGKSTLLKMLAGIYTPTKGTITVNGSLTPFIELGVGFNPELTGRENVFLNGALLGFNRNEMAAMYDDIVKFAELERFMDQKLKNYSSGMQVRLAFSIAIRARSDILLLDEVLAVGDELFQRKCYDYFDTLKRDKKTVILVTHDMTAIERYCTRAVLIKDGEISARGEPHAVAKEYTAVNMVGYEMLISDNAPTGVMTLALKDATDKQTTKFESGDIADLKISWDNDDIDCVGVAICKQSGECVFSTSTRNDNVAIKDKAITYRVSIDLGEGNYFFQVGLFSGSGKKKEDFEENGPEFMVRNTSDWMGLTTLKHQWKK